MSTVSNPPGVPVMCPIRQINAVARGPSRGSVRASCAWYYTGSLPRLLPVFAASCAVAESHTLEAPGSASGRADTGQHRRRSIREGTWMLTIC
jgi:hypothetical protein